MSKYIHKADDTTLDQNDVTEICSDIIAAQTKSEQLGRVLKVPIHTVESIIRQDSKSEDRLLHVIDEFVKQVEPTPTWRVILEALRNPLVNLPRLAEDIEKKYGFVTPRKEHTSPPKTAADATPVAPTPHDLIVPYSAQNTAADATSLAPTPYDLGYRFTLAELKDKIEELERKFDKMRTNTLKSLEMKRVIVRDVVYELTTLKSCDRAEHEIFLKKNLKTLREHKDLIVLFEDLNFYWDYLSPSLLEHIAKQFYLEDINKEMNVYNNCLKHFRIQTLLNLFCQIEVKYIEPTEEFCNIVVRFKVSMVTTLQDVEDFRRRYASHYNLHDFTIRLNSVLEGSFIVSFLVPESIIGILKVNISEDMLREFGVTQLDIAGSCVYSDSITPVASSAAVSHSTSPIAIPISSSATVPSQSTTDSHVLNLHSVVKSSPHSMSMIVYGMHRSMSAPEIHHHQKPEELFLAQQLQQKEEQLQSSERETKTLRQQLTRKETELTRAEETIRREQKQIQEMRQRETELVQEKEAMLAKSNVKLEQLKLSSRHRVKDLTDKLQYSEMAKQMVEIETVQIKETARKELTKKEKQLQSSEREIQTIRQQLRRKEAELTRAIRREQQQIQEMRQREIELVQAKDIELAQTQQQLRNKDLQFQSSEREKQTLRQQLTRAEETIRRKQQHIQEMRQRETELMQTKDRELAQAQQARMNEVENLMKQLQSCVNDNQLLRQQIQVKDNELAELRQKGQQYRSREVDDLVLQLQFKEKENQRIIQQLAVTRQLLIDTVQAKDRKIAQSLHQIREKEEELQFSERERQGIRQQLTRKEAELTSAVETIRREQQQIQEMRQREEHLLSSGTEKLNRKEAELTRALQSIRKYEQQIKHKLTVQCYRKTKAPTHGLARGSATTDHQFVYFAPYGSNSVYSYKLKDDQWDELPSFPCRGCALVIINDALTGMGGRYMYQSGYANRLLTIRQGKWVEEYPPMNTARSSPAVVSTFEGDYIIVIGGEVGIKNTDTVELFQVKTKRWYELTSIPQPLTLPSATLCGNQLHVIGWEGKGYTCSIHLLSSDQPITLQSTPQLLSWTLLPRLPVTQSTAATLYGQLVVIGGWQAWSPVNSIHQLVGGEWVVIGSMTSSNCECLVVSPSPDRMMIVGGYGADDIVEECVVL